MLPMPLFAALFAAATGLAATVAFVSEPTGSREATPALTATSAPAHEWTRRGQRPTDRMTPAQSLSTSTDAPRRGMRINPASIERASVAGPNDWTRRGARKMEAS